MTVYLKEVDYTTFETATLEDWSSMSAVYTGTIGVTDNKMEIELTTPYDYGGGNLMIGFQVTTWGTNYAGISWYGVNQANGTNTAVYNNAYSSHTWSSNVSLVAFIPKTTFTYELATGTCDAPATVVADPILAHEATLTWTGGSGTYNVVYKKVSESWDDAITAVSNTNELTCTMTGLDANTAYQARVISVCGDGSETYKTLSFTTPIACPAPTGLTVALTPGDGTKATFSWDETGSATQWQLCINGDEDNLITVTDNPFTYDQFTPEQTYTAKVRAYCDDIDQSEWSNTVTFTPTNAFLLTVNDGTNTNSYVPFYGLYANIKSDSQLIIPASELSVLQGNSIDKLTFYANTASATWNGAVYDVYMTEVDNTVFTTSQRIVPGEEAKYAFADWATMTKVYTGSVSVVDGKMVLTLDESYPYAGGNLLIGFDETTNSSNYNSVYWYGVNQAATDNTALYQYGSNSVSIAHFLPKVTFGYSIGGYPKPKRLAVSDITANSATIGWTAPNTDVASYKYQYMAEGGSWTTLTTTTDLSAALTGLSPLTNYTFQVQAVYSDGESSFATITFTTVSTCPTQDELTCSEIGETSATISWDAHGITDWNLRYSTDGTTWTTMTDGITNPFVLDGLTAGTYYHVQVQTQCNTEEWSETLNFTTDCAVITITSTDNYTQDFENPVTTAVYSATAVADLVVPACWDNYTDNTSEQYAIPHIIKNGGSYNYSSPASQVLYFYGDGNGYAALPVFSNPLSELQISFKYATESSSNGTLTLGYITAEDDGTYNTFTAIEGANYPASSDSYQKMCEVGPVELSSVPATATRLVFRWYYSDWYGANIDDVEVSLIPSCKLPTGLTCTDYTATTATLDWTAKGTNQTAWQLYISESNVAPADDIDESEVISVTTKPYTVTGLTAEKTYYAWVRGNCTASSDGYSEWIGGIEFTPSYYHDFTLYSTATSNSTSTMPFYGYYANTATDKGQMIVLASSLPEKMLDATVRRLTFYTTSSDATADWGDAEFDVLMTEITDASFATAAFFDWDDMETVYSGHLSVSNNKMVIDFDTPYTYTGGNLLIGFNLTTTGTSKSVFWVSYSGSSYLGAYQYGTSNVSISKSQPQMTFNYQPSETPRPANLHPTEELSTSATLAWTAPYSGTAIGYEYQYKLASGTDWSAAETTTELNASITGLTPEATYDFRVRAVYPGPAYSEFATTQCTTTATCPIPTDLAASNLTYNSADLTWTASPEVDSYTVEYRTAATEAALFKEDFESESAFAGWTFTSMNAANDINATGTNHAGIHSDAAYSGSYGFRFSSYTKKSGSEETYDQYLVSPELTVSGELKFYAKQYGTGDDIYVGYSTTTNDLSAFTWDEEALALDVFWKEFTHELPANVKYIAFHYFGDYKYYAYVDDITIGAYDVPAGSWTAATTTAPNTGEYQLTGLEADTKYDVRVYTNCTTNPDDENATATFTTYAFLELADNADNSTIISDNNGKKADVTLSGRTLWKDGGWNTLCLPFDLTAAQVTTLLENPTELKELDLTGTYQEHSTGLEDGTLYLVFKDATSISAGVPYIIKWEGGDNLVNPVFTGVTINNASLEAKAAAFTGGKFIGSYIYQSFTAENKNVLLMGGNNTLYYPQPDLSDPGNPIYPYLGAFRAYFQLENSIGNAVLYFGGGETTGVVLTTDNRQRTTDGAWYTLQGLKLGDNKPTAPGVYIHNGKKVVIK